MPAAARVWWFSEFKIHPNYLKIEYLPCFILKVMSCHHPVGRPEYNRRWSTILFPRILQLMLWAILNQWDKLSWYKQSPRLIKRENTMLLVSKTWCPEWQKVYCHIIVTLVPSWKICCHSLWIRFGNIFVQFWGRRQHINTPSAQVFFFPRVFKFCHR